MKKSKKKLWVLACVTTALVLMSAGTALADEEPSDGQPRNQWINMEKGPGVAQWVDENGVVTEQPGVKPEANGGQPQEQEKTEESQGVPEGDQVQSAPEGEQPQEGQTDENGQPVEAAGAEVPAEEQPAATGRVIDPNRPMVALTFDDGPQTSVGNQIMDCLAQYGGKATFYMVGDRCASRAAEVQRMVAEGHEVGNHTYQHKYLNQLDAAQIQYQVNKGNEAIQAACGVYPATMRLPGGNKNATVLANISQPIILWSIDTLDWKTKNTQSTVDAVLNHVKDGDIVLMHELYPATGNAAVQIIPALVARGYQLVTVSEMAQYRGGLQGGKVYYSFRP